MESDRLDLAAEIDLAKPSSDGHRTVTDMVVDKPSRYRHGHTRICTIGIWSTTSMVSTVNNTVVTAVHRAMYSQRK